MSEQHTTLYCYNHPQTETSLRCNNCDKPICPKCAIKVQIGYRCPECVRGQQKKFETAMWYDYPVVFIAVGILTLIGSILISLISRFFFGIFTFFLTPVIGYGISEVTRFIISRRRAKSLFQLAAISSLIFSLPLLLISVLALFSGGFSLGIILSVVWQGFYTFTIPTTIYYRLRGIRLK